MRVLFATAEAYPLAKTGGLGDVSRALPMALARRGVDVRILLPAYPNALRQIERPRMAARLKPILGIDDAVLISGYLPDAGVPVLLVDAPSLFQRDGGLYRRSDGQDWPDNALRFAFFSHVAAALAMGRTSLRWIPDVVHANDWHTGLIPLLLSLEKAAAPGTVFTAHNMAFQGNFPADVLPEIEIPSDCFTEGGVEFYGQVSFLKAGLRYSGRATTVSPTYAKEVLMPEGGCGMDGVLRGRGADFNGILNGIDDDISWNPATDIHLPQTFRPNDVAGKRICKVALQRKLGLPADPQAPLVGFASRLAHQKMADAILSILPWLSSQGAQFVLVGEGERDLETEFEQMQPRYPASVSAHIGYDEALAHLLQGASDILLAPARFEPCGLTQLYALRYGALPIVRRTGGLADTVVDATPAAIADRSATGFVFEEASAAGLSAALGRALALYREPLVWRRVQLQGMTQDFSWDVSGTRYLSLYRDVAAMPSLPSVTAPTEEVIEESARQIAI
jgi:starch synthase